MAIGLTIVVSACARSVPAPVVYGTTSQNGAPTVGREYSSVSNQTTDRNVDRSADRRTTTVVAGPAMPSVARQDVVVQTLDAGPAPSAPATAPVARSAPVVASVAPRASVPVTRSVQPSVPTDGRIAGGVYVVNPGDTLYAIARRSGVPLRELVAANRLRPPYSLNAGRRLAIPSTRYHKVQNGETLYAIAHAYKVSALELARLNRLGASHAVRDGQSLRLPPQAVDPAPAAAPEPARTQLAAAATVVTVPAPTAKSDDDAVDNRAAGLPLVTAGIPLPSSKPQVLQAAAVVPKEIPTPPRRASSRFAWPVSGRVVSAYGAKDGGLHNDGINLAVPAGTPFRAADNGVVTYVGNEIRGFGNLVLVRHAGGWVTTYAHASRIEVQVGQTVRRGQILGRTGSTGHVRSPQLHFEIRRGRNAVDPLRYLAPQEQERVAFSQAEPATGRPGPG